MTSHTAQHGSWRHCACAGTRASYARSRMCRKDKRRDPLSSCSAKSQISTPAPCTIHHTLDRIQGWGSKTADPPEVSSLTSQYPSLRYGQMVGGGGLSPRLHEVCRRPPFPPAKSVPTASLGYFGLSVTSNAAPTFLSPPFPFW